jgi:23S rRNA (guanosine2251-2'-O)-methyltransferase
VSHQGIAAFVEPFAYTDLDRLCKGPFFSDRGGLLLVADHITDEGNLGALMRTAAFFRVDGLIIPKNRSARVSAAVQKRAAGATAHIPVARVVNLGRCLDFLESKGFWIIGTASDGPVSIFRFEWDRSVALILGNEQQGLSRPVRRRCHQVVKIPSGGAVDSLNVAVAGGVVLSEILRQRQSRPDGY